MTSFKDMIRAVCAHHAEWKRIAESIMDVEERRNLEARLAG